MSKYHAKPIVIDGIRFASHKEGRRYQELVLLQRAGEIKNLRLQPEFDLHPWVDKVGTVVEPIGCYRADFAYEDQRRGWRTTVEDVKGFKTPLYRWKKKHVEAQYGVQIVEI